MKWAHQHKYSFLQIAYKDFEMLFDKWQLATILRFTFSVKTEEEHKNVNYVETKANRESLQTAPVTGAKEAKGTDGISVNLSQTFSKEQEIRTAPTIFSTAPHRWDIRM